MSWFKKKASSKATDSIGKKSDEISVNMSGNSYFIVDIDSLVNSPVVKKQAKKAREAVPNT